MESKSVGLDCPVCFEPFDVDKHVPHAFPCLHNVCARCLELMVQRCQDGDGFVNCPQRCSRIPSDATPPINFGLRDALQVLQSNSQLPSVSSFPRPCPHAITTKNVKQLAGDGYASAQFQLAQWLFQGKGAKFPQNQIKAVEWYQKAAQQNHIDAQFALALCCEQGHGIPPSVPNALHWFQRAATAGHLEAKFKLANHLITGDGVTQDVDKAKAYFRECADAGLHAAQLALAIALEPQDPEFCPIREPNCHPDDSEGRHQ